MVKQAVILAGGRGSRLQPLTKDMPKPMAPVNGRPFLDYLIYSLLMSGIEQVLILLGYKGEIIENYYKDDSKFSVAFSHGKVEDKTGKRLMRAYDQLSDYFLLVYGDNYWTLDLHSIWTFYQRQGTAISTTVFSNKFGTGEYGFRNNILVLEDQIVGRYDKRKEDETSNGVDIGYFIVRKSCLDTSMAENVSFEDDILTKMIRKKEVSAYVTDVQYFYITDLDSLRTFEKAVAMNKFHPLPNIYFRR